jgi:hypothetical protein
MRIYGPRKEKIAAGWRKSCNKEHQGVYLNGVGVIQGG